MRNRLRYNAARLVLPAASAAAVVLCFTLQAFSPEARPETARAAAAGQSPLKDAARGPAEGAGDIAAATESGADDFGPQSSGAPTHHAYRPAAGGPARPVEDAEDAAARAKDSRAGWDASPAGVPEHVGVPSIWPVAGELTDGFGVRRNPFGRASSEFHAGQDISAAKGTRVFAAAAGTVIFAGRQRGYGNLVIIDHGDGLTTRYGHLSRIGVAAGRAVSRSEGIGRVGSTGRSTGPHLHYEVRVTGRPVDPLRYLPNKAD